ncbi:MAG TPA: tRNA (adenosine(37)-N6)-threonylcarbamoyltransferase complex transferase subunit TsaD [Polyangiaceae bacterium]|nr:tRNA (adenosine(37)-N6)-threonylcarbamoyltransferase complex transferase subunit TsaD [Polyangiaceae bacterium]
MASERLITVLGIETSCDETAAAVVRSNGDVLSDVIESQVAAHAPYGGIVPELASRDHLRNVRPVIEAALERAGVGLSNIDGIAVTARPGLAGALHVGAQAALGLAFARDLPIVGVDHLVGHLCAAFLQYPGQPIEPPTLPFLALLVSGGHTALYRVDALTPGGIRELGATRDDAAGEAYDKVGKLLGLGYPGGPVIDKLAHEGDATRFELPRPMSRRDSLEFSFSGLKTNVARYVEQQGRPATREQLCDLCAAFQERVVTTLVRKSVTALVREQLDTWVIGGGVAANKGLRTHAAAAAAERGARLVVPIPRACTDNAAMIAFSGALRLLSGENHGLTLAVSPHTELPQTTRKGRGARPQGAG